MFRNGGLNQLSSVTHNQPMTTNVHPIYTGEQSSTESAGYDAWRDIFKTGAFEQPAINYHATAETTGDTAVNSQSHAYSPQQLASGNVFQRYLHRPRPQVEKQQRNDYAQKRYDSIKSPSDYNYDYNDAYYDRLQVDGDDESITHRTGLQQPSQSVLSRVYGFIFSPTVAIFIALPLLIAVSYYLFVLNGPTPVIKARSGKSLDAVAYNTYNQTADTYNVEGKQLAASGKPLEQFLSIFFGAMLSNLD